MMKEQAFIGKIPPLARPFHRGLYEQGGDTSQHLTEMNWSARSALVPTAQKYRHKWTQS